MSAMRPISTLGQPLANGTLDRLRVEYLVQKREFEPIPLNPCPLSGPREWRLNALTWATPQD